MDEIAPSVIWSLSRGTHRAMRTLVSSRNDKLDGFLKEQRDRKIILTRSPVAN